MQTPKPTDHPAGSEGKIKVLEERYQRGQALWHEDDNPLVQHQQQKRHRDQPEDDFGAGVFEEEEEFTVRLNARIKPRVIQIGDIDE